MAVRPRRFGHCVMVVTAVGHNPNKPIQESEVNPDIFREILYEMDESGIVTLTLNTPVRKNALSHYTFHEIFWALDHFESDDAAHAMIITGAKDPNLSDPASEAFSSGGYFKPDANIGVPDEILREIDLTDFAQKRTTLKAFECSKPIVAAINGFAIGGAYTFSLAAADLIFMSEHAWIQLPFTKFGISPELGSSFLLPRLVGLQRAKEILFYGERIDAQQALSLQLVNEVLPHGKLLSYSVEKTLQLIPPQGAGLSIREMKKLVNAPHLTALADTLDRENVVLQKLFSSSDFEEGIAARNERRAPIFSGA